WIAKFSRLHHRADAGRRRIRCHPLVSRYRNYKTDLVCCVKVRSWKFFDCNAMIGDTLPPLPAPIRTASELLREMDRFGIEQALFHHYAFSLSMDSRSEMNRRTLEIAQRHKRLVPCWVLSISPVSVDENLGDS